MARQARKCTGRKTNGSPCSNYAMNGAMVCHAHGGRAKQVRAKSVERLAEQQARADLARIGVTPVADPLSALADIAGEVVAWKNTIATKVNELSSLRYSTETGEQLRAEVALWERALDRCEKFLGTMARLRIDERLVAIEKQKADIVITAVEAALAKAGVTGERAVEAKREAARHLRAV